MTSVKDIATTYPVGYGTERVSMAELQRRHGPNMHPEYARRLWAWLESEGGKVGIGSGYRSTLLQARLWASNPRRYARPGSSYHESHKWGDGIKGYAAVDLVVGRLTLKHRSPTWHEGDSAPDYGLHAFIRRNRPNGEPWHLQFIETRGMVRPLPTIPVWGTPTPTPPPPPIGGNIVNVTVTTVRLGDQGGWVRKMQALLTTFGQDIPVDGDFGPQTDAALRGVQSFLGTTSDGICGPTSWGILLNIAPD